MPLGHISYVLLRFTYTQRQNTLIYKVMYMWISVNWLYPVAPFTNMV